jgi:Transposase zinc-ribbon domain
VSKLSGESYCPVIAETFGLDYLDWLRWPEGFRCPLCAGEQAWKLPGTCSTRVGVDV